MNKIFFTIMMTIFFGGCAAATKLDLNIDKDEAANLPKELAIDYLTKITQKHTYYFFVNKGYSSCIYSENGVIAAAGDQKKIKYSSTYMAPEVWQNNRQFNLTRNIMEIYLKDSNSDVICGVAGVGLASSGRSDIEYQKEFIRIAKKVATALKSLGVEIRQ